MAAYGKSLARLELTSIPPAPRGVAQITVMFDINIDGIVSFTVQAPTIGSARPTVIHPSDALSQAEVIRLVNETRAREAEEKSKNDLEAVVRQLDALVANTMRSVQALEGKLTGEEQNRILQASRGDAVPAQRVEPGREEARLVEPLLPHPAPGVVAQDLGVDLLLPERLELLALGVVVEAGQADERLLRGGRWRDDLFYEVLAGADANHLAGLGNGHAHRGWIMTPDLTRLWSA
jgi:hypothetical protein